MLNLKSVTGPRSISRIALAAVVLVGFSGFAGLATVTVIKKAQKSMLGKIVAAKQKIDTKAGPAGTRNPFSAAVTGEAKPAVILGRDAGHAAPVEGGVGTVSRPDFADGGPWVHGDSQMAAQRPVVVGGGRGGRPEVTVALDLADAVKVGAASTPVRPSIPTDGIDPNPRLGPYVPMAEPRVQRGRFEVAIDPARPQVVLEKRVDRGWKPVASRHVTRPLGDRNSRVSFDLPWQANPADYRAVTYSNAKFPMQFSKGATVFPEKDEGYLMDEIVGVVAHNGSLLSSVTATSTVSSVSVPSAVESDIWQIAGSRLLFFNQYRGLQVFDLTTPAAPVKTGALRMAASGEQMYVLDAEGSLVVLISKMQTYTYGSTASEVVIVRVTGGVPAEIARLRLDGNYEDSRLIGDQLHITTSVASWQPNGVKLVSLDLSHPESPRILSTQSMDGFSPKLQSVGDRLLVATTSSSNYGTVQWMQSSTIFVFAPIRGMATIAEGFIPLIGTVFDKFKMSIVGDTVAVVTQGFDLAGVLRTWVETHPLPGTGTTASARVEITGAAGEALYATRFDGTRLYVVTFRRIDPLFVVDLADPAHPQVSGELQVPGYSTYLEPLGDRLLAVGVENQRVTASLFDVHDLTAPTLLSRVALGGNGQSWSEANYDEKAVEYLPEEGLLLLPFQSYGVDGAGNWGYSTALQAIDVGESALTLSQTIRHAMTARRGSVINGYIVSISGRDLVVVDRQAPENAPVVEMSLSWQVDRVVPFGPFLLQAEFAAPAPMLRVTSATDADALIEEIQLGNEGIVGFDRRGDDLFVAQSIQRGDPGRTGPGGLELGLRTWRFDLSHPPEVRETGRTESWPDPAVTESHSAVSYGYFGTWGSMTAVYPDANRLVWCHLTSSGRPTNGIYAVSLAWFGPSKATETTFFPIRLSANSISAEPRVEVENRGYWGASAPIAQNGMVLWSSETEQRPNPPDAKALGLEWQNDSGSNNVRGLTPIESGVRQGAIEIYKLPPSPVRTWPFWSSWSWWTVLSVIDFNQSTPVVRDRVPLPGRLIAVSHLDAQGGILVAIDSHDQQLRTLAYDGVACWQFDDPTLQGVCYDAVGNSDAVFLREEGSRDLDQTGYALGSVVNSFSYDLASRGFQLRDVWTLPENQAQGLAIRGGTLFTKLSSGTTVFLHAAQLGERGLMGQRRSVTLSASNGARLDDQAVPEPGGQGIFIPYGPYGVEFAPWDVMTTQSTPLAP
jgi:hypothetical protein